MRLWHKDLLEVLPQKQICSQWRECCAIAKSINEKGTPNHILVNKIMNYPIEHFISYTHRVYVEMLRRGYKCDAKKFTQYFQPWREVAEAVDIYPDWHNDRYYLQCFFNLCEKYDCDGINQEEWDRIYKAYNDKFPFGFGHI